MSRRIYMREIKFRGKAVMTLDELDKDHFEHEKGWVIGSLIVDGNDRYIVGNIVEASDDGLIHEWWLKVHPESVGQFTGYEDYWKKEIYEGDIFKDEDGFCWKVKWDGFSFIAVGGEYHGSEILHEFHSWQDENRIDCLVIGNIYENPGLLEVESDA